MIDRFGKEIDFSELFMEETLSAKDKKTIPDDQWGLIIKNDKGEIVERKFPLNDETHVRQAAIFFDRAKGLSDDQKRELARNIVRRAKELDMDYSGWESLKPYLDKPVNESYDPDLDSIFKTSVFDECINDDEYYGEADQALMNQIQKKEDNIPLFQLRTYAKNHLSKRSVAGTIELVFKIGYEYTGNNSFEKRCHGYFLNLLREIDNCIKKSGDKISAVKKPKWFFYERKIKQLFNLIGVDYTKDRTLSYISGKRGIITFNEKESIKYTYDPNTDILIHRSRHPNINMLMPSHESRDGIIYPRPRIYCYLEQRANLRLAAQDNGQYGDNVYEIVIPKSITVFRDMEYGKPHDNSKYAKEVFINTNVPLKAKPITSDNTSNQINQQQTESQNMSSPPPIKESFEEMFGPVIQEAFDAITGEEIPINHAYTMEEMAKRSLSLDEAKAMEKDELIPIKPPKTDEVYFGSPTNHMPEIDLNRPLFVSPYKGIASIFIWGDMGLQDRIPRGSYNHNYEEWINFDEKKMKNPLKEVHVYVEGAPFLEPFTVEQEGYIHCISTKDYLNNFFRKPWMTKDLEYLIAKTDNMKVEFTRSIKCKVKYYIKGRPSPKGKSYGPSKSGVLQYIDKIAKSIHAKYKADQKEPTGNQNCLLCAWCAEASIRGGEYLPRPVYSPRDPALEIVPGDIVGGVTKKNPGNFYDMLEHLRGDSIKQPFARWYCHVKWGHGNGGHEFLIVKIDEDAFNIMDPQQGIVRPLTADDSYMKNIDWEGTYICRIDDKPFKYMKLDKINDPKKTLPWDPKKDIPYMVKHGLCTKEEAEKELKKMETNLFTSELKKALNQTPIQESHTNTKSVSILYKRWSTKNGEQYKPIARFWDIVEKHVKASKLQGYGTDWTGYGTDFLYGIIFKNGNIPKEVINDVKKAFPDMIVDNSFSIPSSYEETYSGDTENIDSLYDKIWSKGFLSHELEEFTDDGKCTIRVSYKNKVSEESSAIQEGAWNDIRNGVNPWSKKRVFHITQQGHLDGQIFNPRVPEYLDKYDPSKDKFEDVDNPRVCFSPSIEGALNAIMVTIGRWKTADKLRDWYVYIPEKPIDQYKHKTTKELVKEKKVYDANVTNEVWIEEPVRLKQYGIIRVDQVSDKHIKKTVPTTTGFQGHRYRYDFKYHWVVKPKVIADVPYDYTPMGVCKDMVDEGYNFKYGLGANGSVHKASPEEYDKNYRLESPEEFEKNGGGICFDYVEWETGYLEAYGYTCRKFFISTETDDNMTHTFILADDGNGGLIYPEISFELLQGVHEVKSPEEAIRMIIEKMIEYHKAESIKYYVWEYSGHPPYGSNIKTCTKYFSKGEPFHEGTMNKPEKIK